MAYMALKASLTDWLLLLLLALIWGSSFILMKKGLEVYDPVQVATLRIAITAVAMFPFLLIRWKEVPGDKVKYIVLQALFGNFIPAFLFTAAQRHIDSSMAGILNSLSPVFVLLLGILFFSTGFSWLRVSGMIIAFSGSVLLLLFQNGHGITSNSMYGWLIVLATCCYGISANIIKRYLADVLPVTINAVAFSFMLIPALIILGFTDLSPAVQAGSRAYTALGYIATLGILGSGLASVLYFRLIHNTTALFASSVTYLVPVVALFWGFLAGEPIGWPDYAGMVLILCGVYLVGK